MATRIKAALIILLYGKISKLTAYVIKSSELGKITNLLSSDLGVFEIKFSLFLNGLNFPITMIGVTIILVLRIGWPGVIGILIVLLVVPIASAISKNNSSLIK